MQQQADRSDTHREGLHAALLDYAHSPGKYPVAQRRPAVLFASVRDILQIAVGRDAEQTGRKPLQDAACFFIRSAMLHAGADHYALLGLTRDGDGAALKDHYRLLMRLIHPDFSGTGGTRWPADSAVRVNMAYDVLSSPVRRREYDAALAAAAPQAQPSRNEHRRIDPPRRAATGTVSRSGYKTIVVVCGAAGGLVLAGLFMSGRDGVHLVQRQTVPKEALIVVTQQPAPAVAPAPPATVARLQPLPLEPAARLPSLPEPLVEVTRQAAIPARVTLASVAKKPPVLTPGSRPPTTPAAIAPTPAPITLVAVAPSPAPVIVPAPPAPAPQPAPSSPPPRPVFNAGLSLAEAQPLLAVLLQHLESGRGERLVNMLEREARGHPGAQALSRHYERLVEGMRPVRLSHVEFKAEPADGRLLVIGNIGLQGGEQGNPGKKIIVRAEFASRAGNVVMIGLSGEPGN